MLKCLSASRLIPVDLRRAFPSRFTAIFNKRLVALLFSVLYQRFAHRRRLRGFGEAPLADTRRAGLSAFARLRIIRCFGGASAGQVRLSLTLARSASSNLSARSI